MIYMFYEFVEDFVQDVDLLCYLKCMDLYVVKIVQWYYVVNCDIYCVEINVQLVGDFDLIEMCKECMMFKDQIVWILWVEV